MARLGRSFPFQPNLGGESPVLRKPSGLSPLAKSTTPGQLTTRVTLVAARTAREQPRHFPLPGWDGTLAKETGFSTAGVRGAPSRNLGPRPPRVILALPPQQLQTVGVALAAVRTARQNASSQRFPLQGWDGALIRETGFSTTTFRSSPNRNLGPRPPRVILALPPQGLQTIGVSLVVVRTRREWTRHFWRQEFSGSVTKEQGTTTTRGVLERVIGVDAPEIILPLPTLRVQTILSTLVAVRRRVERNRREFPASFLSPPQVVSLTPSQEQQTVSAALIATRNRSEYQQHFPLQGWDGTLARETRFGGIDPAGSFGYTSSDVGTQVSLGGDAKLAVSVLATEPLSVTELHAIVGGNGGTANARMGVYADLNGAPGALLASSQTVALVNALTDVTFALSTPLLLFSGKTYWLVVQADAPFRLAANLNFGRRDSGTADIFSDGLSDPYGAASISKGNPFVYAVGTVPNGVALLSRNLGPKPPQIQDPLPAQRLQTVETTLAAIRSRLDPRRAPHSFIAEPTVTAAATFAPEPILVALARIRPAKTEASLTEPTVLRVPSVEQAEDTIRVALVRARPQPTTRRLGAPTALQTFAGPRVALTRARPRPTTKKLAPPTLVRVPSVEQREDTVTVALAPSPRNARQPHSRVFAPTVVRVPSVEQAEDTIRVVLVRIRPRPTTTRLAPPKVVRVPSVEQRENTITATLAPSPRQARTPHAKLAPPTVVGAASSPGPPIAVTLAGRARLEWQRHYTQHILQPPTAVAPLAARQTLMSAFAVRRRAELARRAPHSTLRAPAPYTFPLAQPTTPGQLTTKVTLAGRTRSEWPRRFVGSKLSPALYLPPLAVVTTLGQLTIKRALVRIRPPHTLSNLGKPTLVRVPSVEQQEDTIRATLAPSSRLARAPHSRLSGPTSLQVFRGPATPLVRIRPPKTAASLAEPTVIRVPSVEQREDTITVALASVSTRTGQPPRAPHSTLGEPLYLSPLAVTTTPGHLRVAAAFAGRTRREIQRLRSIWQLSPPEVVRIPSVEQREDTVGVALAPHSRLARAAHSKLAPPTTLQVFTGPRVALAPNPRQARSPHSTLGEPQAIRAASVEQRLRTISVTLAGRTRMEERRHRVESVLGPARYLSPLAKSTTPGQLAVRETLVQIRTRTEQPRHASHWKLSAPTKIIPAPTLREQQTVKVTLAGRTRTEISRHASHWKLAPPTKITPLTTLRQQTITVWLAERTATEAIRHAPHSTLRPPTRVIPLPSLEQQTVAVTLVRIRPPKTAAALRKPVVLFHADDTILVTLASHSRLARSSRSRLGLPTTLRIFDGPRTQLARIRPAKTVSKLAQPTVLRVPSVEQAEDTVRVALAPSPRQPRASRSRLAPPTVLRVPSVEQQEDTIRVSLAPAPRQPRAPHSRLAPPTVTRPAVDTIRFTLASAPRNARQPHSRLAPPTVVTRPAPRTEHVAVALVDVVDRVPSRLRKTRSRLAPPTVIFVPVPPVAPTGGIGGSGMSDEEYERLLRRLGALPKELGLSDLDLEDAVYVLRMLGFIE